MPPFLATIASKITGTMVKWFCIVLSVVCFILYFFHLYSYKIRTKIELQQKDEAIKAQQNITMNIVNQSKTATINSNIIQVKKDNAKQSLANKNSNFTTKVNCEFKNFNNLSTIC